MACSSCACWPLNRPAYFGHAASCGNGRMPACSVWAPVVLKATAQTAHVSALLWGVLLTGTAARPS